MLVSQMLLVLPDSASDAFLSIFGPTGGPPLVRSQLVQFPLVRIFRLISKIRTSGIVYVVKSY